MAIDFTQTEAQGLVRNTAVVTGAPFTLAGWARLDSVTSNDGAVVSIAADGTFDWTFIAHQNARIRFNVRQSATGENISVIGTTDLTVGPWYHFAGVARSTSDREAYVNGTSEGTSTTDVTPDLTTGLVYTSVGMLYNEPTVFSEMNGQIEHAAVWNVALTAEEIRSLADGTNPRRIRPAAQVGYWSCLDTNNIRDMTGNGNDLSLNGATTPTTAGFGSPVRPMFGPAGWRGAFTAAAAGGDPEAGLIAGKLMRGGLLMRGALVG